MELRRNHQRANSGNAMIKFVVFAILLCGLMVVIYRYTMGDVASAKKVTTDDRPYAVLEEGSTINGANHPIYIPDYKGEIVQHQHYTLSYLEDHEQAEWVAYELTQELLRVPNVPRADRFEKDPLVSTGSAGYYDYRGSGYTRGHLAPAGDMAFSKEAMEESFYMSNMSPQLRSFNNGVWKELEEQTRDWVYHNKHMYIITGPVLVEDLPRIDKEKISIPIYFYKVLLTNKNRNAKGIAFLIPHKTCTEPLQSFAVTIDSLESFTGIDFFHKMPELESLESTINLNDWKFSEARYNLRVSRWNQE